MAIKLISDKERMQWTYEGHDAGFIYRRPLVSMQRDMQARHTVKGVTDFNAVFVELFEWAIYDWFGFVDYEGKVVPYKRDLLGLVPEVMKTAFITELYAVDPEIEQIKN